ncbi:MAG: DNA polymerase III subunit delta [Gammaproteobacteria bacterium]
MGKGLAPVYLICGAEPFQVLEAADAVRSCARDSGYTDRHVMHVERGFDWQALHTASANLSLFAERQLIDLRIPDGKPGAQGGKALSAYCESPPQDTVLLIQSGKLERAAANSSWAKAIESIGVVVQVWPLSASETRDWVVRRLRKHGITAGGEVAELLAQRVEGNLLAAAQEIDKLALLCDQSSLDAETALGALTDSSRFDVYALADTCLGGDAKRAVRILRSLRAEGAEPTVVLWALSREVRELTRMSAALGKGESLSQVLQPVWGKRKPLFQSALKRGKADRWPQLLRRCVQSDKVIKGQTAGNAWDELLQLTLAMAGMPLFGNHR